MKFKTIMAISASIFLIGANMFVISAKQGSENCKNLLSKTFSFNHFAYSSDPGSYNGLFPTGNAYPNGIADCKTIGVEEYAIDVKLSSKAGQNLKKYVDAGGSLSTSGIPHVNGTVSLSGGNNSNNSSNNDFNVKIVGTLKVNVTTARPQYIYCDYRDSDICYENTDPCSKLKLDYLERALTMFGLN